MSALAAQQAALFSLITRDGLSAVDAELLVKGGALKPRARVDVYGEMYVLRTRDALRDDFPHVARLLGEKRYANVVAAYVDRYQSTHYSLARLGHAFAHHLARHPPKGARADLADLATLEWARAEAFVAENAAVATQASMAALGAQLGAARLRFVPSFALVRTRHDVGALWAACEHGGTVPRAVKRGARAYLVWRKGLEVFHAEVAKDEAKAVEALQLGETVEAACLAFEKRRDPAKAAFTAIASWVTEGMLRAP